MSPVIKVALEGCYRSMRLAEQYNWDKVLRQITKAKDKLTLRQIESYFGQGQRKSLTGNPHAETRREGGRGQRAEARRLRTEDGGRKFNSGRARGASLSGNDDLPGLFRLFKLLSDCGRGQRAMHAKKISETKLLAFFVDTLSHCGRHLLNRSDDELNHELFEEFDVSVQSFFHDKVLSQLSRSGFIDRTVADTAQDIRQKWIQLRKGPIKVAQIKSSSEWLDLFDQCDRLRSRLPSSL